MKKILLTILLGAFGTMAIAAPALAATSVSFTPVNVSVRQGQIFTLTIGVNPQGAKTYTAKTELHYPADLLEVKSFTFANGWMPLSQSGYDLTDNTNGVFIKTAGYPGGVSSAVTFGTVSFLAKKSGSGPIILNNGNSFALDASNQNVIAGASVQTAVAISAVTPIQITTPKPTQQIQSQTPVIYEEEPVEEEIVSEEGETVVTESPIAPQSIVSQFLLASVGSVVTLGTDNVAVGFLVIAVILVLVGYAIYSLIQKARRNNLRKSR